MKRDYAKGRIQNPNMTPWVRSEWERVIREACLEASADATRRANRRSVRIVKKYFGVEFLAEQNALVKKIMGTRRKKS